MFKKIALAYDGSLHSFRAAEKAAYLASRVKDSYIEIITVKDSKGTNEYISSIAPVEEMLENPQVNYGATFLKGAPAEELIAYINKKDFDIIIIGSRGLDNMQQFMLGSVSYKVVKNVKIPALIVK
ncbi:universal stress protein [Alkalicoccus halolimnae]|uniref:Universal stress protein n=1 Tax=Alkalicoccus halolimnae TaxID=1667239 RepID=A0A5C7F7W7_9BACI|nr:universal stress protein [Alkalicoccus halolimnae]TXF86133.1 universal stress protein [Alkalicoccus halolimnae]